MKNFTTKATISLTRNDSTVRLEGPLLESRQDHFKGVIYMNDLTENEVLVFVFENPHLPTLVSCKTPVPLDYLQLAQNPNGNLRLEKNGILYPSLSDGYFLTAFQCKYLIVGRHGQLSVLGDQTTNDFQVNIETS